MYTINPSIHESCLSMSMIYNADETRCADLNETANPPDTFSGDELIRKMNRSVYPIVKLSAVT